jgi:hypothetical protein
MFIGRFRDSMVSSRLNGVIYGIFVANTSPRRSPGRVPKCSAAWSTDSRICNARLLTGRTKHGRQTLAIVLYIVQ